MEHSNGSHDIVKESGTKSDQPEHIGGIAVDMLVSIIGKQFSPAQMHELAAKIELAAGRRSA